MKKRSFFAALTALILALTWAGPVHADGIVIVDPPPDVSGPVNLAIKYHKVTVTIEGQVATTHVDQVFVNESQWALEGTYIFPLPEDAAISEFGMWVDGQKWEGKILERDEARQIYEDIVRRQRDTAAQHHIRREQHENRHRSQKAGLLRVYGEYEVGVPVRQKHQFLSTGPHSATRDAAGAYRYERLSYCLLYTSPSPRDLSTSRMPSSA